MFAIALTIFFLAGMMMTAHAQSNLVTNHHQTTPALLDDDSGDEDYETNMTEIMDQYQDTYVGMQPYQVDIQQGPSEVRVALKQKINESEIRLVFEILNQETFTFNVKFEFEYQGANYSETSLALSVSIEKFVEFVPSNTFFNDTFVNDTEVPSPPPMPVEYNPDTDTVVQELTPGQLSFVFQPVVQEQTDDNATVYILKAVSNTAKGNFVITMYFTNQLTIYEGMFLQPMEMKFDLDINNFAYQNNQSQIAAVLNVKNNDMNVEEMSEETNQSDEQFSPTNDTTATNTTNLLKLTKNIALGAYFFWDNMVTVDNQTQFAFVSQYEPTSTQDNDDNLTIIASFPRGEKISWQASAGIMADLHLLAQMVQDMLNDSFLLSLPFANFATILLALVSVPVAIKIRRRK